MTTYIPRHFAGDEAAARRLIEAHPFATLVTAASGTPHVTHLPLTLEGDALTGHMARPNPHWQAFGAGDSVAIFHGPHAFVSRTWYASPADNVPTWNYAVVHATGRPVLLDDAAARETVEALERRFESAARAPITQARVAGLVKGIVSFRMPIARLEVKLKMSQNKPPEEQARLVAGLRASGGADDLATAAWMANVPSPRSRGEG